MKKFTINNQIIYASSLKDAMKSFNDTLTLHRDELNNLYKLVQNYYKRALDKKDLGTATMLSSLLKDIEKFYHGYTIDSIEDAFYKTLYEKNGYSIIGENENAKVFMIKNLKTRKDALNGKFLVSFDAAKEWIEKHVNDSVNDRMPDIAQVSKYLWTWVDAHDQIYEYIFENNFEKYKDLDKAYTQSISDIQHFASLLSQNTNSMIKEGLKVNLDRLKESYNYEKSRE